MNKDKCDGTVSAKCYSIFAQENSAISLAPVALHSYDLIGRPVAPIVSWPRNLVGFQITAIPPARARREPAGTVKRPFSTRAWRRRK